MRIFLVHGTRSLRSRLRGQYDYQAWNWMTRHLAHAIGDGLEISHFRWSGRNSHVDREAAAHALRLELANSLARAPRATHVLIAHSHGGNVALRAAATPALAEVTNFGGVVCLSTPVLFHVSRNRFRTPSAWRWAAMGAGVLAGGLLRWWNAELHPLLVGLGAVAVWVLTNGLVTAFYKHAWQLFVGLRVPRLQQSKVMFIRHPTDEASMALAFGQFFSLVTSRLLGMFLWPIEHLARAFWPPGIILLTGLLVWLARTIAADASAEFSFVWLGSFGDDLWHRLLDSVAVGPVDLLWNSLTRTVAGAALVHLAVGGGLLTVAIVTVVAATALLSPLFGWAVALAIPPLKLAVEQTLPGNSRLHLMESLQVSDDEWAPDADIMLAHSAAYASKSVGLAIAAWIKQRDAAEDQDGPSPSEPSKSDAPVASDIERERRLRVLTELVDASGAVRTLNAGAGGLRPWIASMLLMVVLAFPAWLGVFVDPLRTAGSPLMWFYLALGAVACAALVGTWSELWRFEAEAADLLAQLSVDDFIRDGTVQWNALTAAYRELLPDSPLFAFATFPRHVANLCLDGIMNYTVTGQLADRGIADLCYSRAFVSEPTTTTRGTVGVFCWMATAVAGLMAVTWWANASGEPQWTTGARLASETAIAAASVVCCSTFLQLDRRLVSVGGRVADTRERFNANDVG